MADKTFADYRFWIDSNTGVLTEITSYVNSVSLQGVLNLMDNGALNDVNGTALPGVHRKSAPINGFINSTTEPIFGPHMTARTSITKTVQIYNGIKYYNGEVWPANAQMSGTPDTILTFSLDLTFEGAANRTSAALS